MRNVVAGAEPSLVQDGIMKVSITEQDALEYITCGMSNMPAKIHLFIYLFLVLAFIEIVQSSVAMTPY